ncbi:MAG: carboxypeptidase regulatory-like domain-containing protein, partial [Actinobacteria bacterium]|nr:carboxypeptidase regulatory-like domain-containing protein [Actinomycetota bacterium]
MKKMKIKLSSIYSFVMLFFILIGCQEDPDAIISIKNDPTIPIISSSVKLIDQNKFDANFISISDDSSTFTFKSGDESLENLATGNILVSDKGNGFLKRILNVNKTASQITIQTEQASISEAFEKANINISRKITQADIEKEIFTKEGVVNSVSDSKLEFKYEFINVIVYDRDNNPSTKHDQIVLNGKVEIDPWFGMTIDIEDWQLKKMDISFMLNEVLDIEAKATLLNLEFEKEVLIKSFNLKPIVFFVGWFPIVITPNLYFYLGANGQIKAEITSKVEQSAEFSAGLRYINKSWSPYSEIIHNFEFTPPTFSAEASIEGYVKPQLDLMLYGIIGPNAKVKLAGELNVSILPDPSAKLFAKILVGVGGKFQILDKTIAEFDKPDLITVNIKIWEKSNLGGKINGNIKDAISRSPLNNVKVTAYKGITAVDSSYSKTDGTYELSLPIFDKYKIVFSKTGYISAEYYDINVTLFGNTVLETVLQIDVSYSGKGSISGTIKNALTGAGVNGLTLKLRKGINVTSGTIISTVTTNSSGYYIFSNIDAGNYTVDVSGAGYNSTFF